MSRAIPPQEWAAKGKSAFSKKDYPAAERAFANAREGYLQSGDELAAAEMANNQGVALLQDGKDEEALRAFTGTDMIFAQAGDVPRQAMALGNQASALEAQNRLTEAAETYQMSADLFEQAGENDLRATVMQSLSAIQLRSGKQLDAVISMQAGLEALEHPTAKQRIVKKLLQTPFKLIGR